jgi:hypothetical protein
MPEEDAENVVYVEFKDPDFDYALCSSGVTEDAVDHLRSLACDGEYWKLELRLNPDGTIAEAKFVDN